MQGDSRSDRESAVDKFGKFIARKEIMGIISEAMVGGRKVERPPDSIRLLRPKSEGFL
jgi:hypothetical protein